MPPAPPGCGPFLSIGVTITPHSAALTEPRTAVPKVVDNIERVRRGEAAAHLVDFAAGY